MSQSYFICGTPRTGSSLLLGLLDSTGVAGHPQAYFRAPDELAWAARWGLPHTPDGGLHHSGPHHDGLDYSGLDYGGLDYGGLDYGGFVRAALAHGSTDNGVFGAKLMWGTLDELVAKLTPLYPDLRGRDLDLLTAAFGRTRFVYLRRDDVVAQAVSWLRAEQSGAWYVGGRGEIPGPREPERPPRYDPDRIRELVRTIEEHNAAWEDWFASAGVRPHRLSYDELAADMSGAVQGILDVLGVQLPDGRAITPRHHRQADDLNAQWTTRFRADATTQ
jgi:trehalose 2-sulfotransferase